MNIFCRYYGKWLIPYTTGELARSMPALASQVARHMGSCPACRLESQRLDVVDRSLKQHVRSGQRAGSAGQMQSFRATSTMVSRVRSLIEQEQQTSSTMRWSPGVVSFAGIAMVAVVMIAIIYPQSYARTWFASELFGHKPAAQVKVTAPVPFPGAVDPFRVPLSTSLKAAASTSSAPAPVHLPEVAISRFRQTSSPDVRTALPPAHSTPSPAAATAAATTPNNVGAAPIDSGQDLSISQLPPSPPGILMSNQPGLAQPGESSPAGAPLAVRSADQPAPASDQAQADTPEQHKN